MGPFKCPDCGIWWAGLEHRCSPAISATDVTFWPLPQDNTTTIQPRCTCFLPVTGTVPNCPIHGYTITYWGGVQS